MGWQETKEYEEPTEEKQKELDDLYDRIEKLNVQLKSEEQKLFTKQAEELSTIKTAVRELVMALIIYLESKGNYDFITNPENEVPEEEQRLIMTLTAMEELLK